MASTSHPCYANSVFKSVRKREQFERKVEKGETQAICRKRKSTEETLLGFSHSSHSKLIS